MLSISKKEFLFLFFVFLSFSAVFLQSYAITTISASNSKQESLRISQQDTLIIGTRMGPPTIDPHDAYDPYSFNYIEQICEGLYACNFSDPSNKIVPRLALDFPIWAPDKLSCTIPLRQNINFQDGAPFNATAVHWNFERLNYFLNVTGNLPSHIHKAQATPEYFWPDGSPIINRTEVIGLYTIQFILNKPFTALEGILSFVGSFILSPKSTPNTDYITLPDGKIVGTGPFICDNFSSNTEIIFHAYENYWRSNSNISTVIYSIYNNEIERCQALLDGDIDFLMNPHESFIDAFNDSEDITLLEPETRSWVIYYIGMN
ncbi:MAG: ABC transporter substrate-binding protein, partial [Promethearchaeota archaeon]